MKKLSFIFSAFLLFIFAACDMEVEEIQRTSKLEYIKVDASKAKIEYSEGEKFSSIGVKVFGYYSDNTIKEEDQRYIDYSGFPEIENFDDVEKNIEVPITVHYGDFTDVYNIKFVEEKVVGIEVQVKKQVYVLYEEIDNDVLIVNLVYDNGRKVVLDREQYTISTNFHTLEVDENKTITIKYKEFTTSFIMAVYANNVSKVYISCPPDKVRYTLKDKLDLTGLVVMAAFGNNADYYKPVNNQVFNALIFNEASESFDVDAFETLPAGKYKLVISIGDIQANYIELEILEAYQTGIALKPNPDKPYKLIYNKGEIFNLNDYKFVQLLSNNEYGEDILTENLDCLQDGNPFDTENTKNTIVVTSTFHNLLTDKDETAECSFEVFVTRASLVTITAQLASNPPPQSIPLGILPDANQKYFQWEITGYLSDGNTITIPADSCKFEFEDDKLQAGDYSELKSKIKDTGTGTIKQNVCISYFDTTKDQYLTCIGEVDVTKPKVTNIVISKFPRTQYIAGEIFNPFGLGITVYTSEGGHENYEYTDNSSYFTYSDKPLEKNDNYKLEITFTLDREQNKFFISLNVIENTISSLIIQPKKKDGPTYIRKGNSYNTNDYLDIYNVQKQYMNDVIQPADISSSEAKYLQFIIQPLNVPNANDCAKISAIFKDYVSLVTGEYVETDSNPLILLPPRPVTASMENSTPYNTDAFAESLIASNTSYTIKYADGTTEEIAGNNFNNNDRQYEYKGFIYTLKTTPTQVKIEYEAKQKDSLEENKPNGAFVIVDFGLYAINTIKKLSILPKDEYKDKLRFRKAELKDQKYGDKSYSTYFYGKLTYYTGCEEDIYSGISYKYDVESGNGFITGKYTKNDKTIEEKIGITVLAPLTVTITPENIKSKAENESLFSFIDESGDKYDRKIYFDTNWNGITYSTFENDNPIRTLMVKNNNKISFKNRGHIKDINDTVGEYTNEMGEDFITNLSISQNSKGFVNQKKEGSNILSNTNWLSEQGICFLWFYRGNDKIDSQNEYNMGTFDFVNGSNTPINIEYDSSNSESIKTITEAPEDILLRFQKKNSNESYTVPIKFLPAKPDSAKMKDSETVEFSYGDIKVTKTLSELENCENINVVKRSNTYELRYISDVTFYFSISVNRG